MNAELMNRIEQLETQKRVTKYVAGALLAAVTIGATLSFAGPRVCDTVWAERIVLQDSGGRSRMTLNAYNTTAPAITFQDKQGKAIAALKVSEDGTMDVDLFKRGKTANASFTLTPEGFTNAKNCSSAKKSSRFASDKEGSMN